MIEIREDQIQNLCKFPDRWTGACPACRENGEDKTGNHLVIFTKNWRVGCAKNQGDKLHCKRIRELVYKNIKEEDIGFTGDKYSFTSEADLAHFTQGLDEKEILKNIIQDHAYWEARKIHPEVIRMFGYGVSNPERDSKMRGRYVFPIKDVTGNKVVGLSGRMVPEHFRKDTKAPKWKHCFKVKDVAYPYHQVKDFIRVSRTVILVESIGDMLALMSRGIMNVIVVFGLNISSKVICTLVESGVKKIVISTNNDSYLDPDKEEGNLAAEKIKNQLTSFFSEKNLVIRLPETGKDWNDANPEEVDQFKMEVLMLPEITTKTIH